MKKNTILIFLVLTSFMTTHAQKIKKNEVDKFTKESIIETSFEKIVSDNNAMNKMMGSSSGLLHKNIWVAFLKKGDSEYLRLKWSCNDIVALSDDSDIIFLDSDGNTYTFNNTGFTLSGAGEAATGFVGSAIYGLNIYAIGDLSEMKNKTMTDLRIHTTDGYIDFKINKKGAEKLLKTYNLFSKTIGAEL